MIREAAVNGLCKKSNSEEIEIWQQLMTSGDLEYWANVWEKLNQLFSDAEFSNLEQKQVIIKAFTTLQQAAAS